MRAAPVPDLAVASAAAAPPPGRRALLRLASALALLPLLRPAAALARPGAARDRFFTTSDGVRLHYLEAGPIAAHTTGIHAAGAHTIVLIPGWTMPAWIWDRQIAVFARRYRVIAFDPRGQGTSQAPAFGYTAARRGQDIAELIARLGPAPVLLVGWSLGVLDVLSYVRAHGDARLAGLVLVDNSVGENPPPVWHPSHGPALPYREALARFVRGMFHTRQPAAWLNRLTRACLRTPEPAARALRAYPVPRQDWRAAVLSVRAPVLYLVRPWLAGQAENLRRDRPGTEIALFPHAGHALFIDDPARFDALLAGFARRRVWPAPRTLQAAAGR